MTAYTTPYLTDLRAMLDAAIDTKSLLPAELNNNYPTLCRDGKGRTYLRIEQRFGWQSTYFNKAGKLVRKPTRVDMLDVRVEDTLLYAALIDLGCPTLAAAVAEAHGPGSPEELGGVHTVVSMGWFDPLSAEEKAVIVRAEEAARKLRDKRGLAFGPDAITPKISDSRRFVIEVLDCLLGGDLIDVLAPFAERKAEYAADRKERAEETSRRKAVDKRCKGGRDLALEAMLAREGTCDEIAQYATDLRRRKVRVDDVFAIDVNHRLTQVATHAGRFTILQHLRAYTPDLIDEARRLMKRGSADEKLAAGVFLSSAL